MKDCSSMLLLPSYSSSAPVWILRGLWYFGSICSTMEHILLWPWCWCCCFSLFSCFSACVVCVPFLKLFREVPLIWLMGSAASCCVDPGETGHTWHTAALALSSRRPTLQSLYFQQLATYMDVHVTGTEVVARVLTRAAMLSLLLSAYLSLFPYPQIMKGWK